MNNQIIKITCPIDTDPQDIISKLKLSNLSQNSYKSDRVSNSHIFAHFWGSKNSSNQSSFTSHLISISCITQSLINTAEDSVIVGLYYSHPVYISI